MHHDVDERPAPVGTARPRVCLAPRVLRAAGALAVILALTACSEPGQPPGPDPDAERPAVEAALDSVYRAFSEAYRSANVQLLMDEVYAPGAYYLPPGSPILQGQDQFRGQFSFLERFARSQGPGPEIRFDIVDRDIADGMAYDIGTYTIRSPGAPPDEEGTQGKFIVIWKRNSDGEWRIWADGFSAVE
ncbi:MAG: nuclear transport factor 2 family protein [Longimicrobiales bacterium]|nr:nuclear transport factor 2 family protein [Longimicrobiales bacterium]